MATTAAQAKPRYATWRQLYRLAATLCEAAGLEAPKDQETASALLKKLEALPPVAASAEVPL